MIEKSFGFFVRKRWTHKTFIIAGFALIAFFIINLLLTLFEITIPFADFITLGLITLVAIFFLIESIMRLKDGSIYEIFYSTYIALILIVLSVIYWISYFQDIDFGLFGYLLIIIHIIVFIYALLTLHHSNKLGFILVAYVFIVVITIIAFAYLHWTASEFGVGFIQYTECMEVDETSRSQNWFYFSSVTFYGLGYGDICPILPAARILSQIEVALGALINTILIGFIFWKIRDIDVDKCNVS